MVRHSAAAPSPTLLSAATVLPSPLRHPLLRETLGLHGLIPTKIVAEHKLMFSISDSQKRVKTHFVV